MRGIGINDFIGKQFKEYPFTGKWLDHIGIPEQNFKLLVFGHPKNGKTEYCIQLSKYLAGFGKVYYNSFEQGISKTLQDALKRNNMGEVSGKVIFGHKETLPQMIKRLKAQGSARFVIIDSRDYMNLTDEQYKTLITTFPRKSFILICWEKSGSPKSEYAQNIQFMVDAVVHISQFKAYPVSRFGGNKPLVIWDKKPATGQQLSFTIE
jgi:hypothetical protein